MQGEGQYERQKEGQGESYDEWQRKQERVKGSRPPESRDEGIENKNQN